MKQNLAESLRWCRRYITFPLVVAVAFMQEEIDQLEAEIKANNDTMHHYRALYMSLNTDPSTLERLVREKYHMQRVNEDVYVITD